MTAARRERKSRHLKNSMVAMLGMIVATGCGLASNPIRAATTELVVSNRFTGLAIDGFDPVAYFVDKAPRIGRPELEVRFAGATWRFQNEGNRAAFAANPEVYRPRFGAYDPIAVARGVATAGHPKLWIVAGNRLFLFYSEAARGTFAENPDRAIEAAERYWPAVLGTLAP